MYRFLAIAAFVSVASAGYAGYAAPAVSYGVPALAHSYAAPVVAHAAPVIAHAAPVIAHAAPVVAHAYAPAHYDFGYAVNDPHTGDSKSQHESRRGDVVQGSYSLIDSDGTRRVVEYTADALNGFNAVVHKEPIAVKTVAHVAAPVAAYAAPAIGYASGALGYGGHLGYAGLGGHLGYAGLGGHLGYAGKALLH